MLDFAKQALVGEQLGKDEITDYLSVSFSSTDYVGHVFGPSSLEAEDNILRLDMALAELLAFIDEEVGLDNLVGWCISTDHSPSEAVEFGTYATGAKCCTNFDMYMSSLTTAGFAVSKDLTACT